MNEEDSNPWKVGADFEWLEELSAEELEIMAAGADAGEFVRVHRGNSVAFISRKHIAALAKELRRATRESKPELEPEPEIEAKLESVPKAGERLIGFFCRGDFREAILGDLAEQFAFRADRKGLSSARWWYWRQVIRSAGAFTWRWMRRLVEIDEVLKRIGF